MTTNLFVYGTLMYPGLYREITGIAPTYETAILSDYSVRRLENRDYPGLIPRRGGRAPGLLIRNVASATMQRLDDYEGAEYQLVPVSVKVDNQMIEAVTYLIRQEFRLIVQKEGWHPDWQRL